jgi:hypothetical protein
MQLLFMQALYFQKLVNLMALELFHVTTEK